MKTNIKSLKNFKGKIIAISDYEGQELPLASDDEHYIICGDILDSTGSVNTKFDGAYGKSGYYEKFYNIRNILKIVNNPEKYTLIYGNRDINKFKCAPLTLLKNNTNDGNEFINKFIDDFNNGNIEIQNLSDTYNKRINIDIEWQAETKNWLPFWNNNKDIKLTDYLINNSTEINKSTEKNNIQYWNSEDKNKNNFFLTRFNKIFGVDGKDGTMSAQNLLYTIPYEIDKQFILNNNNNKNEDFLAFITLYIFRLMSINNNNNNKLNNELNKDNLKGLLHKFYNIPNAIFVGYIDYKDKLMLFTHGGITSNMMKDFSLEIEKLDNYIETNKDKLTNNSIQNGGNNNMYFSTYIKITIDQIQKYYNNLLKTIINQSSLIPTKEMLLLMSLSAPFKPPELELNFINLSPINPGIDNILQNKFYCHDKKLIQVFGHVPKGYSTGLYKFIEKNKELNIINLDISQSHKYSGNAGKTENKITIDNSGNIFVYTNLEIKDKDKNETYIINDTLENLLNKYKEKKDINKVYNYVYHGYTQKNKEIIYSKLKGFEKELYIEPYTKTNSKTNFKEKYLKYKSKYISLKKNIIK
jgi:hypothetical protein